MVFYKKTYSQSFLGWVGIFIGMGPELRHFVLE